MLQSVISKLRFTAPPQQANPLPVGRPGAVPAPVPVHYAASMRGVPASPLQAGPRRPGRAAPAVPPAYLTSAERLFRRHEKNGLTRDQVWTAAHLACIEDARFCDNASPYLRGVRHYKISTAKIRAFKAIPKAQRDRLKKHLANDMVGLALRMPDRVSLQGPDGTAVRFEQRYVHTRTKATGLGSVWSLREGYTLSSEVAKKDDLSVNKHSLEHCANSGYVTADHALLAFRSARCDTALKLEENLVGSCCASLTAAGGDKSRARGWRRAADGAWEYQPILVTAMDKSLVKHLWELIRSFFGGEKRTERTRLAALNAAAKSVFPDNEERTGRYYTIEVGGNKERVFIRPPSIVNLVLSSQANRPQTLRDARVDNRTAAYKMGELLEEALRGRGAPEDANDADTVRTFLHTPPDAMQAMLTDPEYLERLEAMRPSLRLSLEWLHLVLAQSTSDGNALTERADTGVEAILLHYFFEEANLAASVGCKSGVDRTPVLCALFSATHAYRAQKGEIYDPLRAAREPGQAMLTATEAMRLSFTKFADAWATPVVNLTRGMSERIKWDTQPVANDWYLSDVGRLNWRPKSKHASPRPSPASA